MMKPENIREMVERVEWMSPVHYEILNFYGDHDIWITPAALAKNTGYVRNYIASECRTLLTAGLLEQEGQTYRLTDRGRAFLAGDLGADDLEDPRD